MQDLTLFFVCAKFRIDTFPVVPDFIVKRKMVITMKFFTIFVHAGRCLAFTCMLVACGGGSTTIPATPIPVTPTLSLFAGNMGGGGNSVGPVATARFSFPTSVATDSAGNVYVADTWNHTIRKITPTGVVTTLAGTPGVIGSADGTGAAASFNYPTSVATDSAGNVYVADSGNSTIRKITPSGIVSTLAGFPGISSSADGFGSAARFNSPFGVATDSAGNVYVTDRGNSTIRKITPSGLVSTLAGTPGAYGSADGRGAAASFNDSHGIATDSASNVYVADSGSNTIRKITPSGVVSTLAGTPGAYGSADGSGAAASFGSQTGVATDSTGNVYVADSGNNTIRKITPSGVVSTLAGNPGVVGSADGTGAAAKFYLPGGLATDSTGNVYVADVMNSIIRKITPDGLVTTLTGTPVVFGSADGTGAAASFNHPEGVATDSAGNVYVADVMNSIIRKITSAGVVSTLAGTPGASGSTDGSGAVASFGNPTGVATDSAGNVYVADFLNGIIRKITPSGMVSTLAGTIGIPPRNGSLLPPNLNNPSGVTTDSAGNIYVADSVNNTIRKITQDGMVSTLAGTLGVNGYADGTGAAAKFNNPTGIATDSAGNVYVADSRNNTIRKITPSGVVSTLAGAPGVFGSTDGSGAVASFNDPHGIATDSASNVYVADSGNNTIRKITTVGVVSTVVGVAGVVGFTPGTLPGALSSPRGVAISGTMLYITTYNGVAVVNNVP